MNYKTRVLMITILSFVFFSCGDDTPKVVRGQIGQYISIDYDQASNKLLVNLERKRNKKEIAYQYDAIYKLTIEGAEFVNKKKSKILTRGYYLTEKIGENLESNFGLIIDGKEVLENHYSHIELLEGNIARASVTKVRYSYYYKDQQLDGVYTAKSTFETFLESNICYGLRIFKITDQNRTLTFTLTDGIVKGPYAKVIYETDHITATQLDQKTIMYNCAGVEFTEFERPTNFADLYIRYDERDLTQFTFVKKNVSQSPSGQMSYKETVLLPYDSYEFKQSKYGITYKSLASSGVILPDGRFEEFEGLGSLVEIYNHIAPERFIVSTYKDESTRLFGLMDSKGNFILKPLFDNISQLTTHNGQVLCFKSDKFGEKVGRYDIKSGKLLESYRQRAVPRG